MKIVYEGKMKMKGMKKGTEKGMPKGKYAMKDGNTPKDQKTPKGKVKSMMKKSGRKG